MRPDAKATILRHGVPGVEFPTGGTQACQSIEQAQAMADAVNRLAAVQQVHEAAHARADQWWAEYDSAADWCAKRGLQGAAGDPLPENLSAVVFAAINEDPEAFARRVREAAYAIAREGK